MVGRDLQLITSVLKVGLSKQIARKNLWASRHEASVTGAAWLDCGMKSRRRLGRQGPAYPQTVGPCSLFGGPGISL